MALFDAPDHLQSDAMPPDNLRLTRRNAKITARKPRQTDDAITHLTPLPEFEESVHMVSNARFDFWDFVPALIKMREGQHITHLVASTWIINRMNLKAMFELFDAGQIRQIDFITGIYFKSRETAIFNAAVEGFQQRGQRFKALLNHSKFISCRFSDGVCLTIESSANFTENGNIETHVLTNSPVVFAFHAGWMHNLLSK